MYKRLAYSSDDCGFTKIYDLGVIKAFDEGISTHADIMFDSPHTVEMLLWVKERPWLSVGWHRHLWERPVAPHNLIPHMVDDEGRFRWRHRNQQWMDEVPYEEAYIEFKAEMALCYSILRKYPDISSITEIEPKNELERAYRDICKELGIMFGYQNTSKKLPQYKDIDFVGWCFGPNNMILPQEPFADMKNNPWKGGVTNNPPYDLSLFKNYDTAKNIMSITWENDNQICMTNGHTGYLDDYIMKESSATIHRVEELRGCCSQEVKNWIIENKIQLVNMRDALTGSNDYQDHLKAINSPLWVGNYN